MTSKSLLVGKEVCGVKIASDKQAMLFICKDGEQLEALVDADCCSYSWIESVEMPALGLPFTVLDIDDLDMPDLGDMPDCECVAYYGCKLTTSKGDMVIDYRNDSNGYYGGSMVWPMPEGEYNYFYGGVYGQNVSKKEWQEIEDAG